MDKLLHAGNRLHNQMNRLLHRNPNFHTCRFLSSFTRSSTSIRSKCLCRRSESLSAAYQNFDVVFTRDGQWQNFERRMHTLARGLHRAGYLDRKSLSEMKGFIRDFHLSTPRQNKDKDEDDKQEQEQKKAMSQFVGLTVGLFFVMLVFAATQRNNVQNNEVSWNVFIEELLLKGEVERVTIDKYHARMSAMLHPGAKIRGLPLIGGSMVSVVTSSVEKIEDKIRDEEDRLGIAASDRVPVIYYSKFSEQSSDIAKFILLGILTSAIALRLRRLPQKKDMKDAQKKKESDFTRGPFDIMSSLKAARYVRGDYLYKSNKAIYFKDVAGLREAKVEVMEFVGYLKSPKQYKAIGAKIPHGALLLGPPGCGKTLLAKALATEAKVPFFATAGSEFVEIIGGLGATRVRDLFSKARAAAPCIIYIDEIDAIGRKRTEGGGKIGDFSNSEEENTLIQLLAEMDGFTTEENIIVLGSTNRADMLDRALLRPGRFDRHIMIDLPTMEERLELFEMYMGKLQLGFPVSTAAPRLAQLTPGLTGADISNVCNEAAINAARKCQEEVMQSDFEYACERVMSGSAKKTNVLSPFEKRVSAYYQAGHALVSWLLKSTDALLKVSIIPRTNQQLGFSQFLPTDTHLYTTEQLFERMCVHLGGSVTEAVIFNHSSTASEHDLKKVRKMAYDVIRRFGMNEKIGQLSYNVNTEEDEVMIKPYSKTMSALIDKEVVALVTKANLSTKKLIEENKDKLDKLAEGLLQKETLSYEDIVGLIGPPPYGDKRPKGYKKNSKITAV